MPILAVFGLLVASAFMPAGELRNVALATYPEGIPNADHAYVEFPAFRDNISLPFGSFGSNRLRDSHTAEQRTTLSDFVITQTGNLGWSHSCSGSNHVNCGALDFDLSSGTPIYAAYSGSLSQHTEGSAPGYSGFGKYIIIQHDGPLAGTYSIYAHLSEFVAPEGSVHKGQLIGKSGATGNSPNGPHFHFGVSWKQPSGDFYGVNLNFLKGITWNNGNPSDADSNCPGKSTDCGRARGKPEFFTGPNFTSESLVFDDPDRGGTVITVGDLSGIRPPAG
ncbi:MAG TPA: M23 family metallopeptidase, partial [Tepidisphaeraceae bacterium]